MADSWTAGAQRRAWLSAALLSVALLVVPLLVWLLLPRPSPVMPVRREPAAALLPPPQPELTAPREVEAPPAPSAPPPPPREVTAASVGPVRGVVLDPEGHPSAGAVVSCREPSGVSTSADGEGRFELPAEADGCTATAAQPPYGDAEPTRVAAGRDNVLRLLAAGAIVGVIALLGYLAGRSSIF